jgi:hypothetical protein
MIEGLRTEFEAWCAKNNLDTHRGGLQGRYVRRDTVNAFYVWRPAYEQGYAAGRGNLHVAIQALQRIRNLDPGQNGLIAHAALERLGLIPETNEE